MGMREKYQSLALADLKEIAKSRGIKGTPGQLIKQKKAGKRQQKRRKRSL